MPNIDWSIQQSSYSTNQPKKEQSREKNRVDLDFANNFIEGCVFLHRNPDTHAAFADCRARKILCFKKLPASAQLTLIRKLNKS